MLLAARDDGHDWEPLTETVAAGLAAHYGVTAAAAPPPRRRATAASAIVGATLLYVALRPVLGFAHELVVAGLAVLVHLVVATGVWEPAIGALRVDPIYAGAAIRAAGGVQVAGFAVAGPIGHWLNSILPSVFLAPDRVVDGAGISMVAVAGAPAIGRGLAAFGADVIWLAVGLWLCWHWRRVRYPLAIVGLFIQAQIAINHLVDAQVSVADLDASGIPFALALALPNGPWITDGLAGLSPEIRSAVLGAILVVLAYLCALAVVGTLSVLTWVARRPRRSEPTSLPAPTLRYRLAALCVGMAVATAVSPVGALAVGESNWQASDGLMLAMRSVPHSGRSLGAFRHTFRLGGPTRVAVTQSPDGAWQYLVDGIPETIRGVGYNAQYAAIPASDRGAVYTRDFAEMRRLGINTIEGWFEGQFDRVTLDYAAQYGIGVLMPFEINQDWPIDDPNVQQSILDHVSAYVEKYKNHPAVRMWAPGNENLHRILYARWVSQENVPAARARADAFAAFLPRLVDRIHELDPNHPVIYRDAEDVYLGRVANVFAQTGVERPWLIYGANVYSTPRLQQIVSKWPTQWPGHPLLISEFAPGGVGPAERPLGFQQQLALIRSRPDVVLGGMAYTWATNGPEDLDRVFGLVDQAGVPTDAALSTLANAYLADAATTADAPSTNN